MVDFHSKNLDEHYMERFLDSHEIKGKENLEKLKGKQVLYLPNHLSHFDYILLPKIFNDFGLSHPNVIAGSNLDLWPTNKILNDDTGAIFINRNIMKGEKINQKKREEIRKLNNNLERIISNNESLMSFSESGRSYDGSIMDNGDSGILKRYLKIAKKLGKDPLACDIAIDYFPETIEGKHMKVTSFFKGKINFLYYFSDVYSFVKTYHSKKQKSIAKVNVGEPYLLKEYIERLDHKGLLEHVQKDVKELHSKII